MPPGTPRSRGPSRSHSRAASPALSIKSRKSTMSARNVSRSHFIDAELSDDEESDSEGYLDDFRSTRGRREGSIRSTSRRGRTHNHLDVENDSEVFSRTNPARSSVRSNRDRRGSSSTRSVQGIAPAERIRGTRGDDRRKSKPDSALTPDSESESAGTKALVQAKIREKLAQQSSIDESSSDFWKGPTKSKIENILNQKTAQINKVPVSVQQLEKDHIIYPEPVDYQNSMASAKISAPSPNQVDVASVKSVSPIFDTKSPSPLQNPEETLEVDSHAISMIDDGPVGPPPSTPDREWECQFCTFVNEPNTKICSICCKTQILKKDSVEPESVPSVNNERVSISPEKIKPHTETQVKSAIAPSEVVPVMPSIAPSVTSIKVDATEVKKEKKQKSSSSSDGTSKDSNGKIKGKTRKISFWPGTKSK